MSRLKFIFFCSSENEENKHCRGWMCPQMQTCIAEIIKPCGTDGCKIKRSCKVSVNDSSFSRRSLEHKNDVSQADIEVLFYSNESELTIFDTLKNYISLKKKKRKKDFKMMFKY